MVSARLKGRRHADERIRCRCQEPAADLPASLEARCGGASRLQRVRSRETTGAVCPQAVDRWRCTSRNSVESRAEWQHARALRPVSHRLRSGTVMSVLSPFRSYQPCRKKPANAAAASRVRRRARVGLVLPPPHRGRNRTLLRTPSGHHTQSAGMPRSRDRPRRLRRTLLRLGRCARHLGAAKRGKQSVDLRPATGLRPVRDVELPIDVRQVELHRLLGDPQHLREL
jgi:hypothetical protein